MDAQTILIVLVGAVAGGFVNGIAGFGTALMSLGIWLYVLTPPQAVSIVAAMSVVSGMQSLWVTRHTLSAGIHRLPNFLIPALLALYPGTLVLSWVSAQTLRNLIAGLMLVYCLLQVFGKHLPKIEKEVPNWDRFIGLMSGLLGGAASLSGVLPTFWCTLRTWKKAEVSSLLRPFNTTVLGVAVITYAITGHYTLETLTYLVMALPATILATFLGLSVYKRLSDVMFRRVLVGLLLIAAVSMLISNV